MCSYWNVLVLERDQNGMCLLFNVLIYNVIKTGCALFVIYIFLNVLSFEFDKNGNYSFQKVLLLEFIQTNWGKNSRLVQYVLKSTTIPRKGQCPHIEYMRHIRCLFAVTVESLVRLAFYIMKDSVSRCMSCTWFGIWCQIFVHTHSLFTLGTLLKYQFCK